MDEEVDRCLCSSTSRILRDVESGSAGLELGGEAAFFFSMLYYLFHTRSRAAVASAGGGGRTATGGFFVIDEEFTQSTSCVREWNSVA